MSAFLRSTDKSWIETSTRMYLPVLRVERRDLSCASDSRTRTLQGASPPLDAALAPHSFRFASTSTTQTTSTLHHKAVFASAGAGLAFLKEDRDDLHGHFVLLFICIPVLDWVHFLPISVLVAGLVYISYISRK